MHIREKTENEPREHAVGCIRSIDHRIASWYAVHTHPHAETKALANLARQGYQAYLPRYRVWVSHARRRQLALRPLFPRYLFVAVGGPAMGWLPILSTIGVSGVVRAGSRPAPVPGEVIDAIRAREREGALDALSAVQALQPGEMIRVTAGAFEDMVGRLVELRDADRVVVLLELLGRTVRAQLAAEWIEAA